jgi:hypothetical protein
LDIQDESLTVYYTLGACVIMVGGERPHDRHTDTGLCSFSYDKEKPELVSGLAMAVRLLFPSVDHASCDTGS